MPSGVASPDAVDTRFSTLRFFDGVPDLGSTDKIYDNLDFQRAVQAYLLALPVVNQVANRSGILSVGPVNTTVPIWENVVDSRTFELTANDNTPYTWFWIDLHNGPLVIEAPPRCSGWRTISGTIGLATWASPVRIVAKVEKPARCYRPTNNTRASAVRIKG